MNCGQVGKAGAPSRTCGANALPGELVAIAGEIPFRGGRNV